MIEFVGRALLSSFLAATALYAQTPSPGDILINEIMADPDPAQGLPAVEYIELYNRSAISYTLHNWQVVDAAGQVVVLPAYTLPPDGYVLVCASGSVGLLAGFGPVVGTSMPATYLNNDADSLRLIAPSGVLVHTVSYRSSWYRDVVRAQGGYSLELSDPANLCATRSNWAASNDPTGGTPGRRNSIWGLYRDADPPRVWAAQPAAMQIVLVWNELLDSNTASQFSNYALTPTIGVLAVVHVGLRTTLGLTGTLDSLTTYALRISGISDCVGNRLRDTTLSLQLARSPQVGELVLSELLVDPAIGGSRYIELYNRANRALQLQGLSLQRAGAASVNVVAQPLVLPPGAYLALATDSAAVVQRYQPPAYAQLRETALRLPAWDARADSVVLRDADARVLDAVAYARDWHHPLLASTEGVALERRNLQAPTQDANNWHSAASNVRHGTPGYANSQGESVGDGGRVWLASETLVPESTDPARVLHIHYASGLGGQVAQVQVYDYQGRLVRQLVAGELLGNQAGEWQWTGTDDAGRILRIGIYVVLVQLLDANGQVAWAKKIPCVLSGRP